MKTQRISKIPIIISGIIILIFAFVVVSQFEKVSETKVYPHNKIEIQNVEVERTVSIVRGQPVQSGKKLFITYVDLETKEVSKYELSYLSMCPDYNIEINKVYMIPVYKIKTNFGREFTRTNLKEVFC